MRRKRSGLPATCAASIHPPSTRSARSGFIFPENLCRKPRQKAVSPIAVIIENLDQQNDHDQERDQQIELDVFSCPLRRGGRREMARGQRASRGTKAVSLTQPIDGVRLSHRVVRE